MTIVAQQRVAGRGFSRFTVGRQAGEVVAFVMIPVVLLVMVANIWCGLQIKRNHNSLFLQQAQQRQGQALQGELLRERDLLMSREKIETLAGKKLGLYPPAKQQIILL